MVAGSLTRRFLRLFAPIVVVVLVSAVAVVWALLASEIERLASRSSLTVSDASAALSIRLQTARVHALAVSVEPTVRAAISAPGDDDALAEMAGAFTTLLTRNPHYAQVRWIDERGWERVRVERGVDGVVRRSSRLQDKSGRPYFRTSLATEPGQVTLSRLDLNVEDGVIEAPRRPVVRLLVRIADPLGTPVGAIVLNVGMEPLLEELRDHGHEEGVDVELLNSRGEWLLGPDPRDEFAFMEGREVTLSQRRPELWRRIEAEPGARWIERGIWAWERFEPVDDPRPLEVRDNQTPWIIVAHVDEGVLAPLYGGVIVPTGLLALLFLGMFGALTWRLAREQVHLSVARDEADLRARAEWLSSEIAAAANAASDAEEMVYLCLRPLCAATRIGVGVAVFGDRLGMHYIADAGDPGAVGELLAGFDGTAWPRALGDAKAPLWIDLAAISGSEREDSWRRRACAVGVDGILAIPLFVDGEVVASCVLLHTPSSGATRAELEAIVNAAWITFAAQVGRVIAREREAEATERAREVAEAANRAKSEFVANMSHELRTPLNGILGLTEVLRRRPLGEEERAYVEMIGRSGDLLLALINDILDLSKIEARKLELEVVPLSLPDLIDEIAATMKVQADQRGIALSVERRAELPALAGDPKRIGQILLNLVGNALKFTERGSVVIAVDELRRADEIATIRVSVRDTGVGIPADKIATIFRSYEQSDPSTARRFGGTGLGLAIVKHLVELMGGEIGVTSTPGVGSEFWFTLPLPVVAEAERGRLSRRERRGEGPATKRRSRVLVAEDNPINQVVVTAFLEELGVSAIDVAEDGSVAKELLSTRSYDLVLMDMQMPEVGGIDVIRWLRAGGDGSPNVGVTAVALTANAMAEDIERCRAAGMNDFLSKPLTLDRLAATLERWLPEERRASA